MSSQLSAQAITAHTAITRISVSRCSTLPAHRGSARAEKCSTSFSADIAILPPLIKGEPAQPVSASEPARSFHASPLEHDPILVDGSPEPVLRSPDQQAHFVQVPLVARAGQPAPDLVGEALAELARPLPRGLVAHVDAAGGQHLLHMRRLSGKRK